MLLRELLSLGDLLLSLFKPCIELLDLSRLLLGHHNLLLCGSQLTGQVFGLCTECVALMLHGGQLFAQIRLACSFSRLCGELVDLCGQAIHLTLELFVLSRQSTVAFLSLGELGCCDLCGLSCLVTSASCLLGGGLQCRVLLLQGLNLGAELGNLGVEPRNIRAEGLSSLAAGNRLLAKGLHRLGYLIEKIVDFIDVIPLLEPHGLEGMLSDIFRRQQSHKSYTSLWA